MLHKPENSGLNFLAPEFSESTQNFLGSPNKFAKKHRQILVPMQNRMCWCGWFLFFVRCGFHHRRRGFFLLLPLQSRSKVCSCKMAFFEKSVFDGVHFLLWTVGIRLIFWFVKFDSILLTPTPTRYWNLSQYQLVDEEIVLLCSPRFSFTSNSALFYLCFH